MKKIVWSALVVLLIGHLQSAPAMALSCAEFPPIEEAYEQYDGLIVGLVDEVSGKNDEYNEVKVTVQRSFKGVEADQVTMLENPTWGNLNGPSEVGEEYLFFLRLTDSDQWENPLCSPSMKVDAAGEELAYVQDKELPITTEPVPAGSQSESEQEKVASDEDVLVEAADDEGESASTQEIVLVIVLLASLGMILYAAIPRSK